MPTNNEEYQGWSNSKTWNANWRLEQNKSSYTDLVAIRKTRELCGDDCMIIWHRYFTWLTFETWVKGKVNWQEIADFWNNMEFN